MSLNCNTPHATASPGSDAPCSNPAAVVKLKRAGLINFRKHTYVGCWNVRTLLDVGSQAFAMRALHDYHVDIACLSEVRISGSGSRRIQVPGTDASYWLYHSGPQDNRGQHGVAFAVNSRAHEALLSFEAINSRIAVARFKSSPFNIAVVAVYAPTLASEEDVKDEFYDTLQSAVNGIPRRDVLIIAGDWNARTGPSDTATRHILGNHGLGLRCGNGDRLINFADYNRLCVTNTRFQHPKKHLLTWYSNDGYTANQIDYILVRSRWASCVEDSRSYRGAEAGNRGGSDHTLVRAKMRLRLTTRQKTRPPKKFNIQLLDRPEKLNALSEQISEGLTTSSGESSILSTDVDSQWTRLKEVVLTASSNHLGNTTHSQKDWISNRTIELSNQAKQARLTNASNYRALRRQATRSARDDRNRYWAEMATSMETASNVGDYGKLFRLIRQASGKRISAQPNLRAATGELIPGVTEKLQRWVEHFEQLLNGGSQQSSTHLFEPPASLYTEHSHPPTEDEISGIINRLKTRKAPGEDGIPAEIFKSCKSALLKPLHTLFCSVWENGMFPSDWSTAVLLPFHKKGDKSVCNNYRGISLIDVAAKIFAILLMNRFASERHSRTRPNQAGFRPGRGCIDQIFAVRRILEQRNKYQQQTFACFIDFRAAFDSVNRDALWNIMESDGVPTKLIGLVRAYYAATKARVRMYSEESSPFDLSSGVRQGCPLSPILFNFTVDWILDRAVNEHNGVDVGQGVAITDLEFADDIVVFADDLRSMQQLLNRIHHYSSTIGLEINAAKTKVFVPSSSDPDQPLMVNGTALESVNDFKYLGSTILPNGQAKDEVSVRINNARRAFLQLKSVLWRRKEISLKTKIRIYQSAIRPILLYACETWPMRVADIRKMEVFDHWCLRSIIHVRPLDRVSNEEVHRRCSNVTQLAPLIQQRRLRWFGHTLRRPQTDLVRAVLAPKPCQGWRCRRGGQLKTWIDTVKADIECLGLQAVYGLRQWNQRWIAICESLAADRRAWAAAIRDIHEAGSSSRRR